MLCKKTKRNWRRNQTRNHLSLAAKLSRNRNHLLFLMEAALAIKQRQSLILLSSAGARLGVRAKIMTRLMRRVASIAVGAIVFSLAGCSAEKPVGNVAFSNARGGDAMLFWNLSDDFLTITGIVINNNATCKAMVFKVFGLGSAESEQGVLAQLPISINALGLVRVVGVGCSDKEKTTRLNDVTLITNHGTATYSRE